MQPYSDQERQLGIVEGVTTAFLDGYLRVDALRSLAESPAITQKRHRVTLTRSACLSSHAQLWRRAWLARRKARGRRNRHGADASNAALWAPCENPLSSQGRGANLACGRLVCGDAASRHEALET